MKKFVALLFLSILSLQTINAASYDRRFSGRNPKEAAAALSSNSNSDQAEEEVPEEESADKDQQAEKKTIESEKKPDCSKCECKESTDCCKKCADKCKNTGCSTGDQFSGDNSTSPTKGLAEEEAIVQEQLASQSN